jgi:hypothetical protein|nr:MAG TPA: hypothetical protein [Caudoviricetes sp.]DAS13700.1 MAG TPA: hypothetical protein [Caudoviricetes sp.]
MKPKEKIQKIDEAIEFIILNLSNGTNIKEYEIDNVKIVKRSALELINELRRIRKLIIMDMQKSKQSVTYFFNGNL